MGSTTPAHHAPPSALPSTPIVVLGGGNAGLSVAARLSRAGFNNLTVVEPKVTHTYRPMLSFIGAGRGELHHAQRAQRDVIPHGCAWLADTVVAVDPDQQTVTTGSGQTISYGVLVLAPGIVPDWDRCPGLDRALHSENYTTNYLPDLAPKTARLVRQLRSGRAVFTLADGPVPNAGSALKALFMSCDYWRSEGCLGDIDVTYMAPTESIFDVPQVDDLLLRRAADYGVRVLTRSTVTAVHTDPPVVSVTGPDGTVDHPVDLAHLVPPYRGPRWIKESGLASDGPYDLVDVDPRTLQHSRHATVFSLGDAADTLNSKAGAAIRKQAGVVVDNVIALLDGRPLGAAYDGYSAAPIATSRSTMAFAEFGESAEPMPTTRLIDPSKERRATWLFDRYVLPQLYWRLILKGRL